MSIGSGNAVLPRPDERLILIVQEPRRVEHRPGLAAVDAPRQQAVFAAGDVVAALDREVPLGEAHEDLVAPIPDPVIGRPAVKSAFLDRGDGMLNRYRFTIDLLCGRRRWGQKKTDCR